MLELTEGQEITLTGVDGKPLTRVQMAVGWDHAPTAGFIGSGAAPIDLDASAVQFAGGAALRPRLLQQRRDPGRLGGPPRRQHHREGPG